MARVELTGISKRYTGGTVALDAVDLEVAAGEFLVLVGPSGCGKSTLLRIVAGLVEASAGDVRFDGESVVGLEAGQRDVAMVFQNYALYPHMSVAKNLAFPLRLAGVARAERRRRVAETAELLGLTELLKRKPAQLSGGQMQRVAVGRAIVRNPRVFLFDEPLSNLDAKLRGEMRGELRALHERLGITTLYVTHDQAEAMTLGSRVCVLESGRILQVGNPLEVFERPAARFVAGFIGSPPMNLVAGVARDGVFEAGTLRLPTAAPAGPLVLGVRPHDIEIGADGSEAEVIDVERLGTSTQLVCALGPVRLTLACEGHVTTERGERLRLRPRPERLHWFDPESGARVPT
ncbi:MAG: ABC transporter ATP-binding protein [bacterium]|nr:ABC transporter ATP-binding protein [bacterium]